jgi:hypothetical protein
LATTRTLDQILTILEQVTYHCFEHGRCHQEEMEARNFYKQRK